MIVFPRLIVDCLRLEKVEDPTIIFLLTTANVWLFIMFTNYQFAVSNVVKPISALVWLFISFKDVFPVKKEMIYICKEMRMNQQLGTFHYNWNDISLWLDHYSLTGAGYGSLDSLQIPHIWGSRLVLWSLDLFICLELTFVFWPFPYFGILRFCTSQNGKLLALKYWLENYRFLLPLCWV